MSWSHRMKGPALEVARQVELEAVEPQKYLQDGEKSLHARAVALIVVACHEQPKDGWVEVEASGHGGPNEQNISVTVTAIAAEVIPPFKDDGLPIAETVDVSKPTKPTKPPKAKLQEK